MSEQKDEDYGIVYALINEAMPGLVKIGMTTKQNIKDRLSQLFTTGVPCPFKCLYACRVAHAKEVEQDLHKAFEDSRFNYNREFFKIEPDKVVGILRHMEPNDMQDTVNDILRENNDVEHRSVINKTLGKSKSSKRESYRFDKMGIPIGAKLQSQFKRHENIEVEVVDSHNKVRYKNENTTLSTLTYRITGRTHPTPLWTYNGRNLEDLWKESLGDNKPEFINGETTKQIDNSINQINYGNKENWSKRDPNYNFREMQIPIGAILEFIKDRNIKAEVIDSKNKVRWESIEGNLTRITQIIYWEKFRGTYKTDKEPTRPIEHWYYNDFLLKEIYNKTYHGETKNEKVTPSRWDTWNEVTVTRCSEEEVKQLKREAFERLVDFMHGGVKAKIKNSLRAFIIGDALGVPFEFNSIGTFSCNGFTGFGTYNKPAGTWSDDTTVVLCLLDALNKGNLDFDKAEPIFKENLRAWYYHNRFTVDGLFDIGNQTAASINNKFQNPLTDRMGNGALFYLPLAFCSLKKDLRKEDFIRFCQITHNNLNCFNYGWKLCQTIQAILNKAPYPIKPEAFKNRGDVINTSNLVLNSFLRLKDTNLPLRDCLCAIINEGEDTDTNAAILGLLLGLVKEVDENDWTMIREHEWADQIITEFIQKIVP